MISFTHCRLKHDDNRYFDSALGPQQSKWTRIYRRIWIWWRKFKFPSFWAIKNQGISRYSFFFIHFKVKMINIKLNCFLQRNVRQYKRKPLRNGLILISSAWIVALMIYMSTCVMVKIWLSSLRSFPASAYHDQQKAKCVFIA